MKMVLFEKETSCSRPQLTNGINEKFTSNAEEHSNDGSVHGRHRLPRTRAGHVRHPRYVNDGCSRDSGASITSPGNGGATLWWSQATPLGERRDKSELRPEPYGRARKAKFNHWRAGD